MKRWRTLPFALAMVCALCVPATSQSERNVPAPALDDLEPVVVAQIVEAQRKTASILATRASGRDLADAYGSLARLYHAYEFFDAAEIAYANAARIAAGDARWPHLLAYLYTQTGRFDRAAAQFSAARRIQPDDRVLAIYLGNVYLGLNRLADAREEFQAVVETYPAAARRGLGEVSLRERRFAEAADHFRFVLDRAPQATAVHYSLAMAYRGLGRLNDARVQLQQRGGGEVRPADPIVDSLASLVRGERINVARGTRAFLNGQFRDAADAFRAAIEAAPSSIPARLGLGMALAQMGDAAGAATELGAVLRLDPGNVTAHAGLGMMSARLGREQEALDHVRAALAGHPSDADLSEEIVLRLSVLLADRHRFTDAIALAIDAHQQFPARTRTATTLARLWAAVPDRSLRDGARALALAMEIVDGEPTAVHAETMGLALAELGRCGEASEWIMRAISMAEDDADASTVTRLRGEAPKYAQQPCRQ